VFEKERERERERERKREREREREREKSKITLHCKNEKHKLFEAVYYDHMLFSGSHLM
jgi:hypothetical protein